MNQKEKQSQSQPVCVPEEGDSVEFDEFNHGNDCDYEMKEICDHCIDDEGKVWYKVQFKDYQTVEATWLSADAVSAPNLIQHYHQVHPLPSPSPMEVTSEPEKETSPTPPAEPVERMFSSQGRVHTRNMHLADYLETELKTLSFLPMRTNKNKH